MRAAFVFVAAALTASVTLAFAQQDGPYKVLKSARVGGEGGWDYIYADAVGRKLYIPRGAAPEVAATDTHPVIPASLSRLTVYDLDTLTPLSEIAGVGGNGTAVDPKSGHGFTSDHPKVSMFDTKTGKFIKSIAVADTARPDASTLTLSTSASTSSATPRRTRPLSMPRRAMSSGQSTWAAYRSRPWQTARAGSTSSCRTRLAASPWWT